MSRDATVPLTHEALRSFIRTQQGSSCPSIRMPSLQVRSWVSVTWHLPAALERDPTHELCFPVCQAHSHQGSVPGASRLGAGQWLAVISCHCRLHPGLFQGLGCCQELPGTGAVRWSQWPKGLCTGCVSVFGGLMASFRSPEFMQNKSHSLPGV